MKYRPFFYQYQVVLVLITIATCPVQIAMAQHHHRHANYNNHQSNIDATDIYSRSSSGKTNADAIDTTLAFVDATDIATASMDNATLLFPPMKM